VLRKQNLSHQNRKSILIKSISSILLLLLSIHLIGQDLSDLYQDLSKTVVTLQTIEYKVVNSEMQRSGALGSGVVIGKDGLILTAAHVVESANTIAVKLYNGQIEEADILSSVPTADLALLKLRSVPNTLYVAKQGDSQAARIGSQIMVIGAPLGLEHSLSVGHISGKKPGHLLLNGEQAGLIQTDAAINHGNSGGPMFNMNGELIGIVSFILSESGGFEGIGFGVDINSAKKILLEKNEFWTGFDGVFLNPTLSGILNVPDGNPGLLVQRVSANSFAERAGLKGGYFEAEILGHKLWLGGDIILSIQGIVCNSPHNFATIKQQVDQLTPGQPLLIEVLRQGKVVTLNALQ